MKNKTIKAGKWILSLVLSMLMIFSTMQTTYINAENNTVKKITAFNSITEKYVVEKGTSQDSIGLPSSLSATVNITDNSNNTTSSTESLAVIWKGDNYNALTAGTYSFNSTLNDGSYALESGVVMPQVTVTVEDPSQDASKIVATSLLGVGVNMGDAYVAGNGNTSAMGLIPTKSTINSYSTGSIVSKTGLALKNGSQYTGFKSVDVSYEYRVKKFTTSGGVVSFNSANGTWLSGMSIKEQTIDGVVYYVMRGHHTYTSAQIIPGEVQESLLISIKEGVQGETLTVDGKAWFTLDGEDQAVHTTSSEITVTSTARYDILDNYANYNGTKAVISGYYNKFTKTFYGTAAEAAGDPDAVFGRFYNVVTFIYSVNESGTIQNDGIGSEKYNGTIPITWNMNYSVTLTDKDKNITSVSGENSPLFIDSWVNYKTSDYIGYVNNNDISLGGYLNFGKDSSDQYKPYNVIGVDTDQTVANEYIKNETLNNGTNSVPVQSLFFVPLDDSQPATSTRKLTVTVSDFTATSRSGQTIIDYNTKNNSYSFIVPPRTSGGTISQELRTSWKDVNSLSGLYAYQPTLYVDNNSLADMEITAVDQFLAIDADAFAISQVFAGTDTSFGGKSTHTTLYGTKTDGSNWVNQDEQFCAKKEDLLWYDSVSQVPADKKIVAVLKESRGGPLTQSTFYGLIPVKPLKTGTYVAALSTEMWNGANINTVTYAGTNGSILPLMSTPSQAIYASAGKNYQKTVWENGVKTIEDKDTYGRTFLVTGYSLTGIATTVMNGTKPGTVGVTNQGASGSAFDISNGERTVAMAAKYKVTWTGGDASTDPMDELHLKIRGYTGTNYTLFNDSKYFRQVGDVYIAPQSAKVTWNSVEGKFESDDMSFTKIEDTSDICVTGGGDYVFYYTLSIGNNNDISNDPSSGEYSLNSMVIANPKSYEQISYPSVNNPYANTQGYPTIIRNSMIGVSKTPLSSLNAPGSSLGWSIASTTAKMDVPNYSMLDVLPYVDDGRGTNVDSSYFKLTEDKISVLYSSGESQINSKLKLYYTTNTAVRTAGAGGVIPTASTIGIFDPASSLGCAWKEMTAAEAAGGTVQSKTYTYALDASDTGKVPTAIVMAGEFGKNEMYYMTLKFEQLKTKTDAIYGNIASIDAPSLYEHNINSGVSTLALVTRTIEGTAWMDSDHDNTMGEDEKKMSEIVVHLYTADGTEIIKDAYGNDLGTIKTDADGKYKFINVPDSTDGWYVKYDLTDAQKEMYLPSQIHTTDAKDDDTSAKDSDFTSEYKTNVFKMDNYADMIAAGTSSATSTHDVGIQTAVPIDVTLSGTKKLTEDDVAKTITDGQFVFTTTAGVNNNTDGYSGFIAGDHEIKADGTFEINTIHFTKAGTYSFTVAEKNLGAAGYVYDDKQITANIVVTRDDVKNAFVANVTYLKDGTAVDGIEFANTYTTPNPVKSSLSGTKKLTEKGNDKTITAGQFTFNVTADKSNDATGTTGFAKNMAEVNAAGNFTFGEVTFTKAGNYSFTVTENDGKETGYTYDASSYVITYSVTLNTKTNILEVMQLVEKGTSDTERIEFDNTYETPHPVAVNINGIKTLNGKQTGIKAGQFTFNLGAEMANPTKGYTMPKELKAVVTEQGTFTFDEITFDLPGTYQFKISEDMLKQEGYTYDSDAVYVTYQVTLNKTSNQYDVDVTYKKGNQEADAVEFHNTYEPVYIVPNTGDKTNLAFFEMTLFAAIVMIAGILFVKKKYEN